ncbi:MAG: UpxY family transcription antiterminator [Bacteroidota bacterium]
MLTIKQLEKKWFVLTIKPRHEKQISKRLTEINIENFVAFKNELRQWHDRKKWVEMPLFSRYIFIHTKEKDRHRVFEIPNTVKYLSIAGKVSEISANEIDRIKLLCSYPGEIKIEEGILHTGDEVIITSGHFKGLHGQIKKEGTKNKMKILLPSLGCFAEIEIDKNSVEKIKEK